VNGYVEGEVDAVNMSSAENTAMSEGGSIYNEAGTLSLLHCSLFSDDCSTCSSGAAAGIYAGSGTTNEIEKTLIIPNLATGIKACVGTMTSLGDVMSYASACSADIVGSTSGLSVCSVGCDPEVVSVATPSAAIEAAVPCGVSVDARGVSRNSTKCDIGAYESP
ncbi:MAG: choice-of-anchor Q domain-containing protein, partial [Polyangiaceae bacterium]